MHCFTPGCNHFSERNTCKFFRFPKDETMKRRWLDAIKRQDREPTIFSRICNCHFVDGEKENGPSIFPWNKEEKAYTESAKKQRKRNHIEIVIVDDNIENMILEDLPLGQVVDPIEISEQKKNLLVPEKRRKNYNLEIETSKDYDFFGISSDSTVNKATQTIKSVYLEVENDMLQHEISKLKLEISKLKNESFGFHSIEKNETAFKYYTGIGVDTFEAIVKLCSTEEIKYVYKWKPTRITLHDQILITFMKLRLDFDYFDLGMRFCVSKHTIGNIVISFVHILHNILFESGIKDISSINKDLSSIKNYESCRMMIDLIEIYCDFPPNNSKNRNMSKALIGVAPNGVIIYASSLYPNSMSIEEIIRNSNIVEKSLSKDLVYYDKSYSINEVNSKVSGQVQAFPKERMNFEQAIRRLKMFKVIHSISKPSNKYSTLIFQLCVVLSNCNLSVVEVDEKKLENRVDLDIVEINEI